VKTSRQKLLDYIRDHRAVTAGELSQALKMTEANARHHLDILHAQGLVQEVGRRPARGKGRPSRVFSLSEQVLGHNLDHLAMALLVEIASPLAMTDEDTWRRIARRLALASGTQLVSGEESRRAGTRLTQALYQAVQRLNDMHYQARWEARPDAPRVILGHCPYLAVLAGHPEICQLDAKLLEEMLGRPVEQTARLAKDAHGMNYCAFHIAQSTEK
jgi:predicted ArsR family transcriptional regulator